ncbi:protoglobin domain-containing protein [Maricaulis parjimensis]|uniref:protoglobin domain-containing protein n=1 Tax=Maricaulis parjimensis TaxID=144023 RepID=UPI00193A7FBC|nr:protoglobin domain-containing protein [Maricaulis parjimensis]
MNRLHKDIEEHRALQREFFRLDTETTDRIRRLKPRLMAYAEQALDGLFDHLMGNPEVAHYYEIPENITYLSAGMLSHCDRLFSCHFDDFYYQVTDLMGERHAKLEFDSHVYTSGYSNLLTRIIDIASQDRRKLSPEDLIALTRITMFDMEQTMGAFHRHRMDKRNALDSDVVKIQHLLTGT